jgi:hypothetical protein
MKNVTKLVKSSLETVNYTNYIVNNCDYCGQPITDKSYIKDTIHRITDNTDETYDFISHCECDKIAQHYWDEFTKNDTLELDSKTFIKGVNRICRNNRLCGHSVSLQAKLSVLYKTIYTESEG